MHTHLRKVGNSRGVIIPASFIEACSLKDSVDLRVEGNTLVIEALRKPRSGWFDAYQEEASDDTWNDTLPDDITEEWEW
jgi:antitoxin MazE